MAEELSFPLIDKENLGAVTISGFAIYASSVLPDHAGAWTFIAIVGIYYMATRKVERKVGLRSMISTLPVTLFASISTVIAAYVMAGLFGHPYQEGPVEPVKLAALLFLVSFLGVFLWYMIGILAADILGSPRWKWLKRYSLSNDQAFMTGDAVVALFGVWMILTLWMGQ